ncbi:PREDICTED: protein ANTI-SILENCING 1 [Lupinus angustifolius]|uniref:protein ANTI-SILENCING 1 n=1 Tax=Lupinus angustifolius TaxID=3871 RepID=UPI00092EA2A7|nr:PREDICTED: protein ANTI-SILENCING 1 [Lupinus angustifolius]XP_019416905.1 PREDICTED: protein ANTI-SILENCING 1 [Lupinus angustifolius]
MVEGGGEEEPEFKWGIKGMLGGKKKDVQFYESFRYDGVDYKRYDSVYFYKEGEPEPFIGKIIKIWENADKSKKVKVLWFFRPCEILNFLEGIETLENELFLAYGDGLGLANINPLEAISGKCNVVCIAKDSRNPQVSDEEFQDAEFVFSRFFDVGKRNILDRIDDDKIADIEVKNIFNNLDSQKAVGVVKLDLDKKEGSGKVRTSNEVVDLPNQKNSQPVMGKANGKGFATLVRENLVSKPSSGEKPISRNGVIEASKSGDKTMPQAKVKGNGISNASLVKQKSSTKPSYGSNDCGMKRITKSNDKQGNISGEKTPSRSKVDSEKGECNVVGGLVGNINKGSTEANIEKEKSSNSIKVSNEKLKRDLQNQRLVSNDGDMNKISPSPSKSDSEKGGCKVGNLVRKINKGSIDEKGKQKCGDSNLQSRRIVSNDDAKKVATSSSKDKYKLQREKDFSDGEDVPSKKLKLDHKPMRLSDDKLRKKPTDSLNLEQKLNRCANDVTRRPDTDRSRWFKGFPWEERMKSAYEQGTLVLLKNLDPSLTSGEVEDIIWNGFNESCTAKMIQRTAFSSPHSGQAFVIFKKRDAAELVAKKLDKGCFLMSNGRPLVGSIGRPCFPEKKPIFYGHHVVDQHRTHMQREMKDAVSTSHCSQPNNIEYEMALEWCLLQERGDKAWSRLFKAHEEELRKVKAKMKSK